MRILVLESSTTSAKAMLFSPEEGVLAVHSTPYAPQHNHDGMQDAEHVLAETLRMGRLAAEGQKVDLITLCGVWHSVLCCDSDMHPVTPVYSWSYTGAAGYTRALRREKGYALDYYRRSGCMPHVTYTPFKLRYLSAQGLKLDDKLCCEQSAYNYYHLTGALVSSPSLISGGGLLNLGTRDYDEQTLQEMGVGRAQLPELRNYWETAPLSASGAALLGLTSGIPVLPPMPDGALNQVGAGALRTGGVATFSVGTSGALRITTEAPVLSDPPGTWCYLSPGPYWISGAATAGACNCLDWALERLFPAGTTHAQVQQTTQPEQLPTFLPFLFGERCPGWRDDRTAGFPDLRGSHTSTELYYGVMQGVLFNLFQCYRTLSALNGVPEVIKLSGGILRSPVWTQMCCDIFGHDMQCPDMEQASMLGAAALAMAVGGVISGPEAFDTPVQRTVTHRSGQHQRYLAAYEAYLDYYGRLMPD